MFLTITVLAYLGPETMLPMTSVVAGVAGVLMMFGRNSVRWVIGSFKAMTSRSKARPASAGTPRRIGSMPVGTAVRRDGAQATVGG